MSKGELRLLVLAWLAAALVTGRTAAGEDRPRKSPTTTASSGKTAGAEDGSMLEPKELLRRVKTGVVRLEATENVPVNLAQRTWEAIKIFPLSHYFSDWLDWGWLLVRKTWHLRPSCYVGTGIVLTTDGLVLTNRHVVACPGALRARLFDDRARAVEVVATDRDWDLAVVRLKLRPGERLEPLALGNSDQLVPGERVYVVGYAFGFELSLSAGILSGCGRQLGLNRGEYFLQVDADLNPGHSGGPLFDERGRVIGVSAAGVAFAGKAGFAIPIDYVKAHLDEMKAGRKPRRALLGIKVDLLLPDEGPAAKLHVERGLRVLQVYAANPAAARALRQGDVIVACSAKGKTVKLTRPSQLAYEVAKLRPGDWLELHVRRLAGRHKTTQLTLKIPLVERPKPARLF